MSGEKRPVQNVWGRNVLSKKSGERNVLVRTVWVRKVRARKHFLSLHFMIVKLPLWLWHSLRLLYECEVLLLLSFKFDLWLVNWFDLIRGNMILLIKNFHLELSFVWMSDFVYNSQISAGAWQKRLVTTGYWTCLRLCAARFSPLLLSECVGFKSWLCIGRCAGTESPTGRSGSLLSCRRDRCKGSSYVFW